MSHQSQLEKSKFRNWVRGGLAYKYLKEGTERFADDFFQNEHARILGVISNTSGNTCNQCSLQSLRQTDKCPNNMCNTIMKEIKESHVSEAPNWKNIDVKKLYTSPWEVAKCFIKAPGYSDTEKAADLDVSGLLHLFINNKNLHAHLSCDMSGTGTNIFKECRERRNDLFHSPEMELEEAEMKECIDDIKAILQDPKELAQLADAKEAVKKLEELMKNDFIITSQDATEVYRDALYIMKNTTIELEQKIQEIKDDLERKQAGVSNELHDKIQDALEKNSDIQLLKQRVESLNQKIQRLQEQNQQSTSQKYDKDKQALQDDLLKLYQRHYVKTSRSPLKQQENDVNIDEVYIAPNMVIDEADKQPTGNNKSETGKHKERRVCGYHDLFQLKEKENKAIYIVGNVGAGKSSFCKKMIQDWCKAVTENSNSVSPHGGSLSCETTGDSNTKGALVAATNESKQVISDDTDDSNDFSATSGSDSEIESLSSDSDFELHSSEFISTSGSDSDQERTCKRKYSFTFDENIDQMKTFEFLFYIPLRKLSKYGETSKMIQAICTTATRASADLIEKVFEQDSERCLIVIDGLDEWRPQQMETILPHESSDLPLKHGINNATVVTLSRPSAKGMLNIKQSEIDQKVELKGIGRSSVIHFIKKYLPKQTKTHISAESLMKKIKKSKLKHLENTPLLLQQLVWMYSREIDFGKSVSDIYCHLINIMFGWFQSKTNSSDSEGDFFDNAEQYNQMTLPNVLNSFPRCEENKRLLIQIANVAFESFMSEPENNSFSRSHLKKKRVSKTAISSLIEVGLLVEENCYDPTIEKTQISFIHMSYFEFFAALYASCQFDEQQSDKNTYVLKEIFQNCKTAADIMQLSTFLKMICGLCPFLITQVSLLISHIVKRDAKFMRQNSEELSRDSSLYQIQELVFSFLPECDTTFTNDTKVYLATKVHIDNYRNLAITSIIPDYVITFHLLFCHKQSNILKWMTQLKHLQFLYIGVCKISHNQMKMVCSFIQEAPLRYISLFDFECRQQDCIGHSIDLSKHERLQNLDIMNCYRITISNINTKHLEAINLHSTQTLDIGLLHNSRRLKELHLGHSENLMQRSHSRLTYNKDVDTVVHSLHRLQTLTITRANIDENDLTVIPAMRNLKHIILYHVRMSLETWLTFVLSLHTLPQCVQVYTHYETMLETYEKKEKVEERKNMFEIIEEISNFGIFSLRFRTRKQ